MSIAIDPEAVGAVGVLGPDACAAVASRAAELIDIDGLDHSGPGSATPLWRTDGSEAWLNTWWKPRDSGFHDHGGSMGASTWSPERSRASTSRSRAVGG